MTAQNNQLDDTRLTPTTEPISYLGAITAKHIVAENIVHLTVQTEQPLPYQPGQYTMFSLNSTQRAFSFATPPGSLSLEFFIDTSPRGIASRYTEAAHIGQTLTLSSAYGSFVPQPSERPVLYIAGGVGIAPLRAHIRARTSSQPPTTLLFGHRHVNRIFLHDEFRHLAQEGRLVYQPVCEVPPINWTGLTGRLTDSIATIVDLHRYSIYVCGSPGMVSATTNELYRRGAELSHVHMEIFT